ncbi:hypothetical protein PCL_08766 [Purpureocillium lilacinum]|uniref:Uncharacterized protein n=1 Tax=Purpureocillium lilacinum TaxID=33203 RepID=A0A2U3EGB8_PURLI|nr:hypothetical protein PCL_08766 [Purpureocillium lilacinum]
MSVSVSAPGTGLVGVRKQPSKKTAKKVRRKTPDRQTGHFAGRGLRSTKKGRARAVPPHVRGWRALRRAILTPVTSPPPPPRTRSRGINQVGERGKGRESRREEGGSVPAALSLPSPPVPCVVCRDAQQAGRGAEVAAAGPSWSECVWCSFGEAFLTLGIDELNQRVGTWRAGGRCLVPGWAEKCGAFFASCCIALWEDESMAWRALMRRQEDDMVLNTVLTTASICSKHVRTTTEFSLMSDRVTQFNLTRPVAQRGADGKWSGLTKDMDTGGAHPRHDGTRRSGRSPAFPKAPPPWEAHPVPIFVDCDTGHASGSRPFDRLID